ncbi:putative F-box/LRR-repeat protein 8 isoform X2 [Maniola jurtina]|uniref:putative F-box/LRR-repeat protein 8 isoform X2 n=1 Tax=Maniola jurtina TaxID=191418 RepID=UPI001E686214|nr:putative F-box/LRR-repeat protein 8 isoform X2 [Maniola jurtina]XP_045775365.1 putative F-box/LRR-repeat protein 8 isoform X2 [Maniola jurtina]
MMKDISILKYFTFIQSFVFSMSSSLVPIPTFALRSIPTHTEDGIPIRKLYVSNLPPKTTRTDLFGVFAQYGFIKSCWLRMGDKGPHKTPKPTYAFVTFSNPADAHKALQAPMHEKMIQGRNLKISPADSWHQPSEDPDGNVNWKPQRREDGSSPSSWNRTQHDPEGNNAESSETPKAENSENPNEETEDSDQPYNILDILNVDCLSHILTYVPINDLIRSERVSRRWQNMVQEYLLGIRMFKTSWWQHAPVKLTTAVLRRLLQRLGASLLRLHIDHQASALNDRTAHTVGKFCPHLEELKVVGMLTKNWNPLIYGCKNLKSLSFVSCSKLSDSSLIHLVKKDSCIESLTVKNNSHVTGLFLTGSNPPKLTSLEFFNCCCLQGGVLSTAVDSLPNLTTLKLDVCLHKMWEFIPSILNKLPKLRDLSLSEYTSSELYLSTENEAFCKSLSSLTELKRLNLSRNIYITNSVLKTVAQSCPDLESLNVSSCNSRRTSSHNGVGDEGIAAVCAGCSSLTSLDVSYLATLSDAGLSAAARLSRLVSLTARGIPALSSAPFCAVLASCHLLEEIDACGCDNVTGEVIVAASEELRARPRPVALYLASTAAAFIDGPQEYNPHKLLTVNLSEDRSNPHLRVDFVDSVYDEDSDRSFDDIYDHEDFDDYMGEDDDLELFLDDEDDDLEDYEAILRMHCANVLLL